LCWRWRLLSNRDGARKQAGQENGNHAAPAAPNSMPEHPQDPLDIGIDG